jgi:hypothetical protein
VGYKLGDREACEEEEGEGGEVEGVWGSGLIVEEERGRGRGKKTEREEGERLIVRVYSLR